MAFAPSGSVQSASITKFAVGGLAVGFLASSKFARRLIANRQGQEGAVAQLGERLICIQEVAGSIPTSSTSVQSCSGRE